MIGAIIRWSIHNRFLVLMLAALLAAWGTIAMLRTPLDAIPDLSDVQVIVKTTYPGQAPQVVEDQVTYRLTTAMLSVPGAKTVRGYSFFNDSFVYVIFEDDRSEEHTSELQSRGHLVCRLLLEKKNTLSIRPER